MGVISLRLNNHPRERCTLTLLKETKANRGEEIHPGSHLGGDRARIATGGVDPGSLSSANATGKCTVGWHPQGGCMGTP